MGPKKVRQKLCIDMICFAASQDHCRSARTAEQKGATCDSEFQTLEWRTCKDKSCVSNDGIQLIFSINNVPRRNWLVVKEDVIRAVKAFFRDGCMPNEVNDTAIVLIPKIPHPECLSDFRPISLCM
jgi:hypothetical protein